MTKTKKIGTLLAVTLATAAPVAANPTKPDPWAGKPNVTQVPPNMPASFRSLQAEQLVDGFLAVFGVTTPRVLRTGSPACGNVQSKMAPSRRAECEAEARTAAATTPTTAAKTERR